MKELKQLGLSEKESQLYIALLQAGSAEISYLAEKAGINRSTAYFCFEHLKELGLVYETRKKKKKMMVANPPKSLEKMIQTQKDALLEKSEIISKLTPRLLALTKTTKESPQVRFYEGRQNIWEIFEDILESKSNASWLVPSQKMLEFFDFSEMMEKFSKIRHQTGRTKSFTITNRHPLINNLYAKGDPEFREIRYWDQAAELDSITIIYDAKIALIALEKPLTGTVIESESISKAMKLMFEAIWVTLNSSNKI